MARQRNVTVTSKRVPIKWNAQGKPIKWKTVKNKTVTKASNVTKGNNPGGRHWKSDSAALDSQQMSEKTHRTQIKEQNKTARTATVATQAGSIVRDALGKGTFNTNTAVEQIVNGGLTQAGNKRDSDKGEDDTKTDWVD